MKRAGLVLAVVACLLAAAGCGTLKETVTRSVLDAALQAVEERTTAYADRSVAAARAELTPKLASVGVEMAALKSERLTDKATSKERLEAISADAQTVASAVAQRAVADIVAGRSLKEVAGERGLELADYLALLAIVVGGGWMKSGLRDRLLGRTSNGGKA